MSFITKPSNRWVIVTSDGKYLIYTIAFLRVTALQRLNQELHRGELSEAEMHSIGIGNNPHYRLEKCCVSLGWKTERECKIDNKAHPELRAGEVFFGNVAGDEEWEKIEFGSKRKGEQAYDCEGAPLPDGITPVFISKEEGIGQLLEESGLQHLL